MTRREYKVISTGIEHNLQTGNSLPCAVHCEQQNSSVGCLLLLRPSPWPCLCRPLQTRLDRVLQARNIFLSLVLSSKFSGMIWQPSGMRNMLSTWRVCTMGKTTQDKRANLSQWARKTIQDKSGFNLNQFENDLMHRYLRVFFHKILIFQL